MVERPMALSFVQWITLSLSLLQRMASNDNGKRKLEEETESSVARKRLQPSDNDGSDDDSSISLGEETGEEEKEEEMADEEEEAKEEVSSEEMSMNQLDTFKEKLFARRTCGMLFSNDGDTPPMLSEPHNPNSHRNSSGTLMRRAATMMTMTSGCRYI
jgi:hypothetical protein